jgi:hypothetical protein
MSVAFGPSVVVSVPATALEALPLPGSVFAWKHLRDAVMAPELRLALRLLMHVAASQRLRVRFVARPEIFTHGASRAWLDERLGDATDHLMLTDGSTLRPLPGLRNHMFFIGRGVPKQEAALARLLAVAPELFAGLASQANGALGLRIGAHWHRPPLLPLRFATTPEVEPPQHAPFLCHANNPDKAAALCAEALVDAEEAPDLPRSLRYVPLTLGALADPGFAAEIAGLAQRAALGAAEEGLLLGLPPPAQVDEEIAGRVAGVLRALAATGMVFPRAPSWHVRFTTAPPRVAELKRGRIVLHPAVPFWRLGADLLAAAPVVEATGSGALGAFRAMLAAWAGREVTLARLPPLVPVPAPAA